MNLAKDQSRIDAPTLSKLRWRCRRGLLENDLFVQRFFEHYGSDLNHAQARGLSDLMELADNDLLDLLLGRREEPDVPCAPDARQVLQMMREAMRNGKTVTATQTT